LGRVLYIAVPAPGTVPETLVAGLHITGGDATGLGGHGGDQTEDAGGGVYVDGGALTLRDCVIHHNVANAVAHTPTGRRRARELAVILPQRAPEDYATRSTWYGQGGGVYLYQSASALIGNTVEGNQASSAQAGLGGGLYLWESEATLIENTIQDNIASTAGEGQGGGLYLWDSPSTLASNIVQRNVASTVGRGGGGGLRIYDCDATLRGNHIVDNVASTTSWGYGGGLFAQRSTPTLIDNRVQGNSASDSWYGLGGGLYFLQSAANLEGNLIITNTATLNPDAVGRGGGAYLGFTPHMTLTNNVIAGNHATSVGSGLWLGGASWAPTSGRLVHNTIANNAGCGQGLHVDSDTVVDLVNTIISGHSEVGVHVAGGGVASLEATLWNNNSLATSGEGTVSSSGDLNGDPAFAGPGAWDYHLTYTSAAIDAGVDAGVPFDMDGDPRDEFPDIGADEYMPRLYLPLLSRN
jgi:hypothetical protein